jgi:hypothetical protein
MPEGHSVHRIAKQFQRNFVGHHVKVSSPQGRFADGAAIPFAPDNTDYQKYLAWVAAGNTPEPADE